MSAIGFVWPLRVYYEDTDAGGVVYHAAYLRFMERARTEWLRALGFAQRELASEDGFVFAVHAVHLNFLRPAYLDDALTVSCQLAKLGRVRLALTQEIRRDSMVLVRATVDLACLDAQRFTPKAMPAALRAVMTAEWRTQA